MLVITLTLLPPVEPVTSFSNLQKVFLIVLLYPILHANAPNLFNLGEVALVNSTTNHAPDSTYPLVTLVTNLYAASAPGEAKVFTGASISTVTPVQLGVEKVVVG